METSTGWSRRRVLVASGSAAAALAVAGPLSSVAAGARGPGGAPRAAVGATTGLRRDHWMPLVGKTVAVGGPAGSVRATVVEVEDLVGAPADASHQFAVALEIGRRARDIGGLRPVTIARRGVATLLVSPVERGAHHRTYQIVVNNLS